MTELLLWIVPVLLAIIAYFMKKFVDGVDDLKQAFVKLQVEFGANNITHASINDRLTEHGVAITNHERRIQENTTQIEVIKKTIGE